MTKDHGFTAPAIDAIDHGDAFAHAVQAALDAKTKPPGSLGELERLAARTARIQRQMAPSIAHAQVIVFAADHGIAAEGVSAYPAAVTAQMVQNFLVGGAAICVLARCHDAALQIVDAGVDAKLAAHHLLLDRKIARGTASFARGPAMTPTQTRHALQAGIALGDALPPHSALIPGEMGIGNTASASALMHALTGLPAADCVGRGTGIDDATLARKRELVAAAVRAQGRGETAFSTLQRYGGFEIAMMAGAMLGAAARRQLVLVDGFIATAAAACAAQLAPALLDYCVFAHVSAEAPHRRWLEVLSVRPLLDLDLRLGEGSGAVQALPLVRSACAILSEMATFADAGIDDRGAAARS